MIDKIKLDFGLEVKENVSLKDYTTFKIGGEAKFFVSVDNKNDLRKALQAALENKLNYFILGAGSNLLISDDGFDGLIIYTADADVKIEGDKVSVFSGVRWPKLVVQSIKAGLSGLEFSANIPGAVGGCVRGNAGAYGQGVGDFVEQVEVLVVDENEVSLKVLSKEECEFAYRESIFKKKLNWIISEVTFKLNTAQEKQEVLLEQIAQEAKTRCAKQPLSYPSAGCSFKNVEYTDDLKQYESWQSHGKIPAARFIDEAGLKGKQIGGAKISEEHANFIVNIDNATASDVMQLISLVKMKVRDEFGVQLQEEVQYLGF